LASLGIARCIGLALEQSSGERLLGDAVKAIDGAISDGTAATLVRAHLRYTQARKQYSRHAVQSTKDDFLTASIDFGRGRSAMSLWADSYAANVLLDEGNVEAALRLLADVETRSAMGYKALRGEIESTRALAYGRNGHLYEATESIRQALNQYESLRESDNCARLRVSLVSTLTVLGQHEEAWRIRFAILEAAASGHPRILQLALNDLLFDQYNARNWDVLAAFADETASISAPGTETNAMALMFAAYARARRSGRFEPATLAAAHAAARQIGDLATRDLVEDEIHFNEADLMMQADPRSAMRLLDDVIAYRTVRFPYRLSAAYAARGRISRHLGDLAAASVAFNRAIDELERQRATLNSQQLLADTYVGDDHRMYEDAMSLEAQRGDYDRVFSIAESTRARVIRARASAPFPAAGRESYGQIDDDTTVVSITILPDLTLLTVMTAGGMRHIRSPATSADIEVLRGSLITSMQREDEKAFRTTAQRLYATLLSPISTEINRHAKLVIVADAKVTGIPFGALVDPRNGRFVLDDHSVVVAPSVSTFLALHGAAATRPNRVLALGDPAFDSRRFPALERLSEARIEVEEVAASYAQSERLIDTAATRDRFLKACKTSDVAHLAAHEIVGRTFATSVIPLAVSADDSGLLYATDIAAMTLTRHPVVMLDGCESAVAAEGSGSVRSFATAFLAAGARSVIGTVMDVDDHDARVFAIAVHRQLRMGVPAAVALRNAQQELRNIAPGAGTRQWMAYQAYGFE
jgi:CHAT domain-containing protein